MPEPAPTPQSVVGRLTESSAEVRVALMLSGDGAVVAHAGTEEGGAARLGELADTLLRAGEAAGARAGLERVTRVEVSRPDGAVFAVRDGDRTLVAIAAAGALSSLLLYDMRMALAGSGATASRAG